MRGKRLSIGLRAVPAFVSVTLLVTGTWGAEKKLHNFIRNGTDGIYPSAGLIFDTDGNLYGTTYGGGDYYRGTVFEMTPNGSGGWTEKKLHNFGNGTDGANPQDDLIFDAAGNLYGTTGEGGSNACGGPGCGTAFELMSDGGGTWTEKRLHNFGNGTDGVYPYGALIFDADGNLYGTTYGGGSNACTGFGCGVAFEMTPNGSGGWTEKKLHNFGSGTDGANPSASLIFDAEGNLYGTTTYGGSHNGGTVFEITP